MMIDGCLIASRPVPDCEVAGWLGGLDGCLWRFVLRFDVRMEGEKWELVLVLKSCRCLLGAMA